MRFEGKFQGKDQYFEVNTKLYDNKKKLCDAEEYLQTIEQPYLFVQNMTIKSKNFLKLRNILEKKHRFGIMKKLIKRYGIQNNFLNFSINRLFETSLSFEKTVKMHSH